MVFPISAIGVGAVYRTSPPLIPRDKAATACNHYTKTATVNELRRVSGAFDSDRDNRGAIGGFHLNYKAPILAEWARGLKLGMMTWGFRAPTAAGGRLVTNVRNLANPFWRSALKDTARRCSVPMTKICE